MVKDRWDTYLLTNGLLNTTVQKAFQPKTSGCEEHHQKLWSVLQDANSNQRSLAIAWIDLENAYGSVPHGLIDFALKYYHAPNKLTTCIQKLYSNLWASILTPSWSSNPIRMSIGVFQGDPLSTSIFNCVIGTLVDTLQYHCHHLGNRLSLSAQVISQLQFADDTCIMARNPQCCQEMLQVIYRWLLWSTMKAKPSKCQAIALRSRCSAETRVYDPDLTIGNAPIPHPQQQPIKFLGMPFTATLSVEHHRYALVSKTKSLMQRIDEAPLSGKQKVKIYRHALPAKMSWDLKLYHLPQSFIQRSLDPVCIRFLKKWLRLPQCGNPGVLFLEPAKGGLGLPSMATFHLALSAGKLARLAHSRDPVVNRLATKSANHQAGLNSRPAKTVLEAWSNNTHLTGPQLKRRVARQIRDEDDQMRLNDIRRLDVQGRFLRIMESSCSTDYWSRAVWSLPARQMSFAVNSAQDTLPHNSNFVRWKRPVSPWCPLCGNLQTLRHVLNGCKQALQERRYDQRHDEILREIVSYLGEHLSGADYQMVADLDSDTYTFHTHICPTTKRPDIVAWNEKSKIVFLIELTVCFDENFADASMRKQAKYHDLREAVKAAGHKCHLWTVQVGSRGIIDELSFQPLHALCSSPKQDIANLYFKLARTSLLESFTIWCSRNKPSN